MYPAGGRGFIWWAKKKKKKNLYDNSGIIGENFDPTVVRSPATLVVVVVTHSKDVWDKMSFKVRPYWVFLKCQRDSSDVLAGWSDSD